MELNTSTLLNIYTETLFVENENANLSMLNSSTAIRIIVLFNAIENTEINMGLLQKVLGACKLTEAQYLILPIAENCQTVDVVTQSNAELVLTFGLPIYNEFYKLPTKLYALQKWQNKNIIMANSLAIFSQSSVDKNALWNLLKDFFQL